MRGRQIPKRKYFQKISFRMVWYSVLIWLMAFFISGFVKLPFYYLVLPIVIFWLTIFYFKKSEKTVRSGLWISLSWFFMISVLDLVEIVGPYYGNAAFYFSDFRNWLKYPLVLLLPVIYSLIFENKSIKHINGLNWFKNSQLENSVVD
ncbi:hypothetical protein HYU92_06130 [Candidatus Curtissbacteria bacterium]|nr:hypothetical protein [Candidatus Curtissbacteria bacterium]